jgi:hypothetical protein
MKIIDQVDIGDSVCCDFCNEEFKGNPVSGGVLFGSYAVCPTCEPKTTAEPEHIKARCPPDKSFHQFIMEVRGGDNTITVYTL